MVASVICPLNYLIYLDGEINTDNFFVESSTIQVIPTQVP